MRTTTLFVSLLLAVLVSMPTFAAGEMGGEFRFRGLGANSAAFGSNSQDGLAEQRVRLNKSIELEKGGIFVQPQLSHTWGSLAALIDPAFSVHQAYMDLEWCESCSFRVGRQEISYGNGQLFSVRPWTNTGRSWDGVKWSGKWGDYGWTDVFYLTGTFTAAASDNHVIGMYHHMSFGGMLENVEPYVVYDKNPARANDHLVTAGLRMAAKSGSFGYDFDVAGQFSDGVTGLRANLDLDMDMGNSNFGLGYALANDDYANLYGLVFGQLGQMNLIGQNNVHDIALKFMHTKEEWEFHADVHAFMRFDTAVALSNAAGVAYAATTGTDAFAGSEIDLYATHNCTENFKMQSGVSTFIPLAYMKDNAGDSLAWQYYLMGTASF